MRNTIDMAREAGLQSESGVSEFAYTHRLEHFSELVRAAEREACAKVCEDTPWSNWFTADCAAAIRARGETK
jgi:hypothetical protein